MRNSERELLSCLEYAQKGERLWRDGKTKQGIEMLETALKTGSDDLSTLSGVYCQLGNAYLTIGEYDKAVEYHSYDMFLARFAGDKKGEAGACSNISNAFKAMGRYNDAINFINRQLLLARETKDQAQEARALYNLGCVYHRRGKQTGRLLMNAAGECSLLSLNSSTSQPFLDDMKLSIQCFEETLALVEAAGDMHKCGQTYGNLGNVYYLLRDYETAIEYHYKRLDVARQFGDKSAQRKAYTSLGNAHIYLSQIEKAIEFYRLALVLTCEMGDRYVEAQTCFNLANSFTLLSDYQTAAEYHSRHLSLARALKDRAGEARAYESLATDYRKIGNLPKATYFLAMNRRIAKEMHDTTMMERVEETLRDVLREGGAELVDEYGEIRMDSSSDPDGERCPVRLSLSLRSLDGEFDDCGLNRLPAYRSEGDISSRLDVEGKSARSALPASQDDFFELLSRMQSKRLDEQRCDPSILSDVTNRKGTRQTDSMVISPNASILSRDEKKARRQSLFGRVTSSVFKPMSTSTPMSKSNSSSSHRRFFRAPTSFSKLSGSLRSGKRSPSMNSVTSATSIQEISIGETINEEGAPTDTVSVSGSLREPQFRIPELPENRRHSMFVGKPPPIPPRPKEKQGKHGPDALIDLLLHAQGRRMDEQRASLNLPGLNNGGQEILEKLNGGTARTELEGNPIDEHLLELLMRLQGERIDEQRSELGGRQAQNAETEGEGRCTIPEDDISALVMRMQAGRLEEQRAHLQQEDESD